MTANPTSTNIEAPPRYFALIPAAGVGARMAAGGPKQYLPLAGKPMLRHTLDAFLGSAQIAHTYVVVSEGDPYIDALLPPAGVTVLRCGGATRMDSVQNALRALRDRIGDNDRVLVHDAARPGLTPALIAKLIAGVGAAEAGGLLALPVVDTVKRVASARAGAASDVANQTNQTTQADQATRKDKAHQANQLDTPAAAAVDPTVSTVPRDGLWLAQTPQMFSYQLLTRALAAATDASLITDDASAVEALGLSPVLVEGHPRNLKVTLPADIRIAEMYLADSSN